MPRRNTQDVFINCAFDKAFEDSFQAIVFAVLACGFNVRCALETLDGTETRIEKLYRIIEQSRYSVHDLSRTELDETSGLPRFNMPLELGIFLGAKRFGSGDQEEKRCLILDLQRYRFQSFISDLAGMDVVDHGGDPQRIVEKVRDWLVAVSRRKTIPGTAAILDSYNRFASALPDLAHTAGFKVADLIYPDYERLVLAWVKRERLEVRTSIRPAI